MYIFDNIGCSFEYNDNQNIVILGSLSGYQTLNDNHIGCSIPYLARNADKNKIEWEIGTGLVSKVGSSLVILDRQVITSSNNNNIVHFSKQGTKQFYLFINSYNFNRAFNNVTINNEDFIAESRNTIHIVDLSSGYVIGTLPSAVQASEIKLSFRTIGDGTLILKDNSSKFQFSLTGKDRYIELVSTGKEWVVLKDSDPDHRALSQLSDTNFSALSNPHGDDRSFQYNDAGDFGASNMYYGSYETVLLGSDASGTAKHIIPTSGNYDIIFNNTKDVSDFIVHGSGNLPNYPAKNLYFTYDGKFGLNMPSGIKPATVLHIINSLCREGIRLENRTSCHPADITLYQNPPSTPTSANDGDPVAQVTLAGKNSSGQKVNYGRITGSPLSVTTSKGQLDFVVSSGANTTTTVSTNPDSTTIQHNSAGINLSSTSGYFKVVNNRIDVNTNNISLSTSGNSSAINLSANSLNLNGNVIVNSGIRVPYINQNNILLSLDNNYKIVAATGFKIPGLDNQSGNKLLSTQTDGSVVASIDVDSYWPYETGVRIGGKDVTWDRYPFRLAQVCDDKTTREIEFLETVNIQEFDVGDQVAIYNSGLNTTIYRNINRLTVLNDSITGFETDQTINTSGNLQIYSITKGGILNNTIYTSGIVSDATDITLSTRPRTPTVFNTKSKDIDFLVYGVETNPALSVIAGASTEPKVTGTYYKFATQLAAADGDDIDPFTTPINSDGFGTSPTNNTVNFQEAAGTGITSWTGMVSAVGTNGRPSYYGTYDQNGNVYEWVSDLEEISISSDQYICGGSWRTMDPNGLRSYIPTPRLSGFDDIGFRVCSKAGYIDTVADNLGLTFVQINQPNNPSDSSPLYTETFDNRFNLNIEPEPITVTALGAVSYQYRIADKEVTNLQYVEFLNAVATVSPVANIYRSEMSSSDVGGILRTGSGTSLDPYVYEVKTGMDNMPVVYVDYINTIRFINWLSNGAPDAEDVDSSTTEDGAYSIGVQGSETVVIRNKNSNYWLPNIHEWHKAAYYEPVDTIVDSSVSAVTIRRTSPFEHASGQLASLSVSGYTYTDNLQIGPTGFRTLITSNSGEYFNVKIGPDNIVTEADILTNAFPGIYGNYISNTGIQFATTGNLTIINKINPINKTVFGPSGVDFYNPISILDQFSSSGVRLTPSGLSFINGSGEVIPGGQFPGPNGGFLYKELETDNISGSQYLQSVEVISTVTVGENTTTVTGIYPRLTNTSGYNVIHNAPENYLSSSPWFTVGKTPSGVSFINDKIVSIQASSGSPLLYTDNLIVGPALESYKGTILSHGGTGPATWKEMTFLDAPGVSWTRYGKRAVEFDASTAATTCDRIKFVSISESKGGTGPISLANIQEEFAFNETIAIYNQAKEVFYAKVSNYTLVDGRGVIDKEFFSNETDLLITVCPPIPNSFFASSALELANDDPDNGRLIGYAFSVQKGAYLDMTIEPDAISQFNCLGTDDPSEYRFKPGTANTISIRPEVHTTFNKVAEKIDFVIYGHRKTLFTRYEPEWFGTDSNGLPSGLTPAFRVHSTIDNSVIGNLESGVYRSTIVDNTASGVLPDLKSKLTINTNQPYKIATLSSIVKGLVTPAPTYEENLVKEKEYGMVIESSGSLISGILDLSTYADLTVNGYTYSSGLISNELVLAPVWTGDPPSYQQSQNQKVYIPSYPLTINNYGQIVSMVPPPNPELPDPPTNVAGVAKNSSVDLTWDAPVDDGGKPVTAYLVQYSQDNGITWIDFDQLNSNGLPSTPNKHTNRTVNNLSNGISYIFRVYAINAVGIGQPSGTSSPITPSSTSPTQPRNLAITGQTSGSPRPSVNVILTWTAPVSAGNTAIQKYIVEYWQDDGETQLVDVSWIVYDDNLSAVTTTVTIPGIDTGPTYYFSVRAENSSGVPDGQSPRALLRSIGTQDDPDTVNVTNDDSNVFDFSGGPKGIIFTGQCG